MLLSIFLPFFNFLAIACFGRFLGKTGTIYMSLYTMFITFILNFKLFFLVFTENLNYFTNLGSWMNVELISINWEFTLDSLAVTMLAMVSLISFMVHMYSISYMKTDPHFIRFISYLSLFTFFMFILVTAGNFVQLFLGWEGVGICSYLLINFWFTRVQANKAAIKAIVINRIGDIGFLLGAVSVFAVYNTLDFTILQLLASPELNTIYFTKSAGIYYQDIICFFFLVGVVGKSAQLGLHTWLPAAIEGPTPVSALIHAATMVTAGIFLIIRVSFLFEMSSTIRSLIVILGAFTALFSALTAIFLYDIKRIIAYSTCSQLGYMAVACGLSQYSISLFHLVNHAFFKALLFLTAGAIIHSFNNEQDIRKLSGLLHRAPFILAAILIGNIAIMGLPFLSGFYSKDLVIELTYLTNSNFLSTTSFSFNIIFVVILIATFSTAVYSLRMYYYLFIRKGVYQLRKPLPIDFSQPFCIQFALSVLMIGSIFVGYLLSDLFSPTNDFFYYTNYNPALNPAANSFTYFYFENEFMPWFYKLAPLICNITAIVLSGLLIYNYHKQKIPQYTQIILALISNVEEQKFLRTQAFGFIYLKVFSNLGTRLGIVIKIFQNNFYFNELYNYIAFMNFFYYYTYIFANLDKGILEFFGPRGLSAVYLYLTKAFTKFYKQGLTLHLFLIYNTLLVFFYIFKWFFY